MPRLLPPHIFFAMLAAIAVLSFLPVGALAEGPAVWAVRFAGIVLFAAGVLLMRSAHGLFVAKDAEINPYGEPRNFVTEGPYRFSRNPMYLSFTLLLLGGALGANSLWALLPVAVFFAACNWFFIPFEERRAAAAFGAEYAAFREKVRRWI